MRIWHVGASATPRCVDGVTVSAWELGKGQAALGHEVWMVSDRPTDEAGRLACDLSGVKTAQVPANRFRFDPAALDRLLTEHRPDVVHLHSVFVPRQNGLACRLRERGIPYVVTPNGGLSPEVLGRGRWKKSLYSALYERPRVMGSAAVTVVTAGEARHVRAFVPRYAGVIREIPNAVAGEQMEGVDWQGEAGQPTVLFLGRFDVLHKGLDLLVEVARRLPGVRFHLYGAPDARTGRWFERLRRGATGNVVIHGPLFGHEKLQVLAQSTMYVQTSRWEGFPLSIAEAMYVGVPCAVCQRLNVAAVMNQGERGLVLSASAEEAAGQLASALADGGRLKRWSAASRNYARTALAPKAVARQTIGLYEELMGQAAAGMNRLDFAPEGQVGMHVIG
jgi:glycosyltransferase involved in cell wall biosynthesis